MSDTIKRYLCTKDFFLDSGERAFVCGSTYPGHPIDDKFVLDNDLQMLHFLSKSEFVKHFDYDDDDTAYDRAMGIL